MANVQHALLVGFVVMMACGGEPGGSDSDDLGESVESSAAGLSTGIPGCPGTDWQDPSSWSGLKGGYLRPPLPRAPAGELTSLTVLENPSAANQGRLGYARTVDGRTEIGVMNATRSNPAIGPVFAFYDSRGQIRDIYFAPHLRRSPFTGKVSTICLIKSGAAFMLHRTTL